jgi:hypothetical protein
MHRTCDYALDRPQPAGGPQLHLTLNPPYAFRTPLPPASFCTPGSCYYLLVAHPFCTRPDLGRCCPPCPVRSFSFETTSATRSLCSFRLRPLVGLSAFSGLLTVALFLYILLIPVIKGIPPNVRAQFLCRKYCHTTYTPLRWRLT